MKTAASLVALSMATKREPDVDITDRVYFDIEIDGKPAGRILFGLYRYLAPKLVENFLAFCDGSAGEADDGTQLWYKGSELYDMKDGSYILGGDVENNDATGDSYSKWGGEFEDQVVFKEFNHKYLLGA